MRSAKLFAGNEQTQQQSTWMMQKPWQMMHRLSQGKQGRDGSMAGKLTNMS